MARLATSLTRSNEARHNRIELPFQLGVLAFLARVRIVDPSQPAQTSRIIMPFQLQTRTGMNPRKAGCSATVPTVFFVAAVPTLLLVSMSANPTLPRRPGLLHSSHTYSDSTLRVSKLRSRGIT